MSENNCKDCSYFYRKKINEYKLPMKLGIGFVYACAKTGKTAVSTKELQEDCDEPFKCFHRVNGGGFRSPFCCMYNCKVNVENCTFCDEHIGEIK